MCVCVWIAVMRESAKFQVGLDRIRLNLGADQDETNGCTVYSITVAAAWNAILLTEGSAGNPGNYVVELFAKLTANGYHSNVWYWFAGLCNFGRWMILCYFNAAGTYCYLSCLNMICDLVRTISFRNRMAAHFPNKEASANLAFAGVNFIVNNALIQTRPGTYFSSRCVWRRRLHWFV